MSHSQDKEPSEALKAVLKAVQSFIKVECRQKGLSFIPRSSDVIISTPMKCGTTWTEQIVHQLRSGGDMDFEDIDDVIPWIEIAYDVGQDLNDEQKYNPRCFKTHSWSGDCLKGAKYIVIYREPCAAFYSSYNFLQNAAIPSGDTFTLDEYVKCMHLSPGTRGLPEVQRTNYFEHLLTWWPRRNDQNVLFLLYEDMLEDLETTVRSIASFIGIHDETSIRNAVEMSKFDYMKENGDKYAGHRVGRYRNKALGIPENVRLQRVVTGSATKGREMMDDCTKQAVQKTWNETITKKIGLQDYSELKKALKKEGNEHV